MAVSPSIPLEQDAARPGDTGVVWDGGDLACGARHGYEPYQKRPGRRRPAVSRTRILAAVATMAVAALTAMAVLAPGSRAQTVRPTAAAGGPPVPEITAVPPVTGHALPWEPEARQPFPGGPTDQLNIWLAQGQASSRALPHEHPPVLFVGDSITQWWTTNGRASWDRWFAPLGAADDGVVADTTSNVLARLAAGQVPPVSPKVIVLMIGTNNLALGQSPSAIVRGIGAVVAALHSHMPKSRIVVLGLLPRDAAPDAYRAETSAIDTLLSRTVRSWHASYLDAGSALLQADGRFVPGVMLPDFLHPSAAGYSVMSGPILRAIESGR